VSPEGVIPVDEEDMAPSRSAPPGGKIAVEGDAMLSKLDKSRSIFSRRLSSSIGLEVIIPLGKEDTVPLTVGMTDDIADETSGIMFKATEDIGILLCRLSKGISGTIGNECAAGTLRGC
jgi:hypothetical protein